MKNLKDNKKILIVDDNDKNIKVIGDCLKLNAKFTTIIALNGKEAVERALKLRPDLILMDINMPVMGGVEACKIIKENEAFKDVPIIFLTGEKLISDKVKALKAGGSDFVTKPFYAEELLLRVTLHLEIKDSKESLKSSLLKTNEMLDNVGQSIFWVDENGRVLAPSSRTTENVFGQSIEEQTVLETLYKGEDEKIKNEIVLFFEQFSKMTKETWKTFKDKIPSKVIYFNKDKKILHVTYKPLWGENNFLNKIMFIIDDRTEFDYLMNQKNIYSIRMVSNITGVQENTIRSWEKRHDALEPFRDSLGKRVYNDNDVEKVRLIKLAIELGMNIGSVASLELEQLKKIESKANFKVDQEVNENEAHLNLEVSLENITTSISEDNFNILGHELKKLSCFPKHGDLVFKFFPHLFREIKAKLDAGKWGEKEIKRITRYCAGYFNSLIFKKNKGYKVILCSFDNPYWELEMIQTSLLCLINNMDIVICGSFDNGKEVLACLETFEADSVILSCGSQLKEGELSANDIIRSIIKSMEEKQRLILTGNVKYSENSFFKYENLIPLPSLRNLETGLKKINKQFIDGLFSKE